MEQLNLSPTIRGLNKQFSDGKISEKAYALRLKNLYDTTAPTLNVESIKFMETKFEKYGMEFSNGDATDGIIKQAISGVIEGFTTFGIADEPDTGTEKIVNSIGHLFGLAPGVVLGGMGMITSATKTVGANLIAKGTAAGSKSLINRGKALQEKGKQYAGRQAKVRQALSDTASRLTYRDKKGRDIFGLGKITGQADAIGDRRYELKSIPGRLADIIQTNAQGYLKSNQKGAMEWLTKGLLRSKFSEEKIKSILNESAHVGLLMAFSQHPLATRNTEGFSQMAMAGVHGGLAGGIFGTIGQYGNISKLLVSTNPTLRKAGEKIVRSTAKNLSLSTAAERDSVINTVIKATAGGSYGAVTSAINELPAEDFIYETLMGVFFSVNGRPAWANRATKDIMSRTKMIPKDSLDKQAWLEKQQWYQDESAEYQLYWKRHLNSIEVQQEKNTVLLERLALVTLQAQKNALDLGIIDIETIKEIQKNKEEAEGMYAVKAEIDKRIKMALDSEYTDPPLPGEYEKSRKKIEGINLEPISDQEAMRDFISEGNEIDFPLNSISKLSESVYKSYSGKKAGNQQMQVDRFHLALDKTWEQAKLKFPEESDQKKRVDAFIHQFKSNFGKFAKHISKNNMEHLRKVALSFDTLSPKKNSFSMNIVRDDKGNIKKVNYYPTKPDNPQGLPVKVMTAGNRAVKAYKNDFTNYHIEYLDYLETSVKTRQPDINGVMQDRTVIRWESPEFETEWKGIRQPKMDKKGWLKLEQYLNNTGKFIYGGVGDTGRKDIRKFLWSRKKEDINYLKGSQVKSIAKQLVKLMDLKNANGVTGWKQEGIDPIDHKSITLGKANNLVGTYLYRLVSTGLITGEKDINFTNLSRKALQKEFVIRDKFKSANKMQKYLSNLEKLEIPFDPKVVGKDELTVVVTEQSPVGRKGYGESGDDGLAIIRSSIFKPVAKHLGAPEGAGTSKGTLFSPADLTGRGDLLGKYQLKSSDKYDDIWMDKHNVDVILNVTSAKDHPLTPIPVTELGPVDVFFQDSNGVKNHDLSTSMWKNRAAKVKTSDFHWNQNVYEHIPPASKSIRQGGKGTAANPNAHKQRIMQEMLLNANTIQFDPATPVGKAYWNSVKKMISKNTEGDPIENAYAEKQLEDNKPLRDDLELDSLNTTLIDNIMSSESIKTKTAESIVKKLLYSSKDKQMIDMEKDMMDTYANVLVGQYLTDIDFSYMGLAHRGNTAFVQKTLRSYLLGRIFRPSANYTYHSVLGEYSWKISKKNQEWSEIQEGLSDTEFMLQEGAEHRFYLKVLGEEVTLGEWWTDFKGLYDPKQPQSRWSPAKKEAYEEAQWALLNRSPILTSGNMRALKFVGFVRGQNGLGTAIITNEKNDAMFGGADKDIDSAHVSFGMPKGMLEGYKQEHIRSESQEGQVDSGKTMPVKDPLRAQQLAGAIKPIEPVGATATVQRSMSQLFLDKKMQVASNMKYGKATTGQIHDALYQLKASMDLVAQKEGPTSKEKWFKEFNKLLNDNVNVSNTYIDADTWSSFWSAPLTIENLKTLSSEKGVEGNEIIKLFKTAMTKHRLPAGRSYKELAEDIVSEYGEKGEGILKIAADHVKELTMEIDPFQGEAKENIFWLNKTVMNAIMKDPLANYFGIRDAVKAFNPDNVNTDKELAKIMNTPHFLFNKMHPGLIAWSLKKSNEFMDSWTKEGLGFGQEGLQLFVREIMHTVKLQKDGIFNNKIKIDPESMSYNEQVMASKEYLKTEVDRWMSERTKKHGALDDSKVKQLKDDVIKLFEAWHISFPYVELDYNADTKKTATFNGKAKRYALQLKKVQNLFKKYNTTMWDGDVEKAYMNEKAVLGAMEWEATANQQIGENNMHRTSSISKELNKESMQWMERYVNAANEKSPLIREMTIFKQLAEANILPRGTEIDVAPGEVIHTQIDQMNKFAPEQLSDWSTMETALDLSNEIGRLEKSVNKYTLENQDVISEIERYGDNLKRILSGPNKHMAFQISELYAGSFQMLNVVAKQGIDKVDYTHLRILNNIVDNIYMSTGKDWLAKKTIHKKLMKEWKELGLDPEYNLLPPDWMTDFLFPTEMGKFISKYENVFKVERVQFIDPKTGTWKEYGARMPASTIEHIGENIGKRHDAGNALGKAYENTYNALVNTIRPDNEKEYAQHKDVLFDAAAMERQLGLKGEEEWNGKEGPRENEHPESLKNLGERLRIARENLNNLPDDLTFVIRGKKVGTSNVEVRKLSPRDMVEKIKNDIFQPFFLKLYSETLQSNWGKIEELIVKNPTFDIEFDYQKFYASSNNLVTKIISGAQSGADMGGLRAGKDQNIPTSGTVTNDFITESKLTLKEKSRRISKYQLLKDKDSRGTPAQKLKRRSIRNVLSSDATIAFRLVDPTSGKRGGTDLTIGQARFGDWVPGYEGAKEYTANLKNHKSRPILVLDNANNTRANVNKITSFIKKNPGILNIAGHRESTTPGLSNDVRTLIRRALRNTKQPHRHLDPNHLRFWETKNSALFLDSHGLINFNKIRYVSEFNVNSKKLQSGGRPVERDFHEEDLSWIHRQIDIKEHIESLIKEREAWYNSEGKYDKVNKKYKGKNVQLIKKNAGQYAINWKEFNTNRLFEHRWLTDADVIRQKVRRLNEEYPGSPSIGYISERYWPLMGQDGTKKGIEYIEEVHIPKEIKRIESLSLKDLKHEDKYLSSKLDNRLITKKQAQTEIIGNMINKLLKNPERYNNPFFNEQVEDVLNSFSTREVNLTKPGSYKQTHARSRASIPVDNYNTDESVPRRYAARNSRGLTQGLAALQTRIALISFRENAVFNDSMGKAEADAWLFKMIDVSKNYMGYPTTRNINLHGITKADQILLKDWQKSGYDDMYSRIKKLGPVEAKLLADYRDYTTLRREEKTAIEDKHLLEFNTKFKDAANDLKETRDLINASKKIDKDKKEVALKDVKTKLGKLKTTMIETMKENIADEIMEREFELKDEGLSDSNIDKTKMSKSFRSFYSDETVANVALKIENAANKLMGFDINNSIKFLEPLPDMVKNPQARHKAWVSRVNWLSDIEGKFEMLSLLSHPKSGMANAYGGTANTISDVGFKHYFDSYSEKELLKHFKGKKYEYWNEETSEWEQRDIESKAHVHEYFNNFGILENNIRDELIQYQPPGNVSYEGFAREVSKNINRFFQKHSIYTDSAAKNKINEKKREDFTELTFFEASEKYNVGKDVLKKGSLFMQKTEQHLRLKAAISHYLKAKEIFTDSTGSIEVREDFLIEYAKRGIAASQFIYHATNRPNFANTAFGRIMTRFHPYSWNSVRRRANLISDRLLTEGHPDFDATKRFERQFASDMMVTALAVTFAASIFEYALSPPMSWMQDMSQLMFGDPQERERAFYNQYGHPLLAPLGIITPPGARFILPPIVSIINNDYDVLTRITMPTWAPFGRVTRDALRTLETPEMFGEYMLGLPVHQLGQMIRRNQAEEEETEETTE